MGHADSCRNSTVAIHQVCLKAIFGKFGVIKNCHKGQFVCRPDLATLNTMPLLAIADNNIATSGSFGWSWIKALGHSWGPTNWLDFVWVIVWARKAPLKVYKTVRTTQTYIWHFYPSKLANLAMSLHSILATMGEGHQIATTSNSPVACMT